MSTVWTPRQKPSGGSSTTEGSPMGLLLTLTYAVTSSIVFDTQWTNRTSVATGWSGRGSIGDFRLTEGGLNRITEGTDTRVSEGITWTNRVRP